MLIQPPRVRQGQFRYKENGRYGTRTVIEVMEVSQQSFEYRTWKPTVEGMITTVGRQVEWTAPLLQSDGDCWEEGGRTELQHLSHRILAGPRQGAGAQRWTQTIQGAFRSLTPEMGTWAAMESLQGPTLSQLADLQARTEALGPYTIYTDGEWEYGGDGMNAPFYPYTDSPCHKGGGSVVFITTDLTRLKSRHRPGLPATLSYVVIRIDQTHRNYLRS